jgi:hypothetical protein
VYKVVIVDKSGSEFDGVAEIVRLPTLRLQTKRRRARPTAPLRYC